MSNSILFSKISSNFQNSDTARRNGKNPMRCISSGNFKFNFSPLTFLLVIGLLVSNTVSDLSVNFIPNKIYSNPNNNFNNENINSNRNNKASVINPPNTDSANLNNRGNPSQNQNQSQQISRELFPGKNDNLESVVAGNSNLNLKPNIKLFERSHRSNIQFSLEDEICLGNYDVSEGTIIRTHDSQKLGAKYLNETDLGQGVKSRDECLRLCCQTPHCNVNVFEEKKSGSCYMFDCGPPEDFRCKFTSQLHYTSAILRKTLPILPNLNQHETELSQLRSMDGPEGNMNKGMEFSILNEPMSPGKNKIGDMDMESIGNGGGGGTVATTTSTTTTTAASLQQQQQQQQQQQRNIDLILTDKDVQRNKHHRDSNFLAVSIIQTGSVCTSI